MKKMLFSLLLMTFAASGPAQAASVYQGSYQGTFVGNFKGTWTCTVDEEGRINDWTMSLAPQAKGVGRIADDGALTVKLNAGGRETVWTASVTADLKIVNGKLNLGGAFEGQGMKARGAVPAKKAEAEKPALKVITLGTGTPVPNPDRACSATLVIAGNRAYLFDTGRGVVNGLSKAGNPNVAAVFFTHFHSDHFGELGELLVTRAIAGAGPLKVIGPAGTKKIVTSFQELYSMDGLYRKAHHKEKWGGLRADAEEAQPGWIYDDGEVKIRMFAVDHAPADPAVGYRLEFGGRSVVISGDTKKVPQMIEMAKDCDILVHDALNRQMVQRGMAGLQNNPRTAAMTEEMMEYHASTLEVAEIAREAGVKKLVLTHLVPSIPVQDQAEQLFIQGMGEIFKGPIIVGRDGLVIEADPR